MKFWYNQSDFSYNTSTKFHQNQTYINRGARYNNWTDRQTHRQIKFGGAIVSKTVTNKLTSNKIQNQILGQVHENRFTNRGIAYLHQFWFIPQMKGNLQFGLIWSTLISLSHLWVSVCCHGNCTGANGSQVSLALRGKWRLSHITSPIKTIHYSTRLRDPWLLNRYRPLLHWTYLL